MFARQCTRLLGEALSGQASTSTLAYAPAFRAFSSSPALFKYSTSKRKPRNEEIIFPVVQRVDDANRLCPPEPFSGVLASIERRTHFVELVHSDPPIVKVMDKKVAHAARKAIRVKQRASMIERKEIQMTWNVNDMDLTHKLKKAREQIERGNIVDIAFAPKAKQEVPSMQTMLEKMQSVVDTLQDIALERQERTLLRGVGIVYLRLDKSKVTEEK